jgi:multidrug efflux pump subunit AcrA (membrane-fusion protein)
LNARGTPSFLFAKRKPHNSPPKPTWRRSGRLVLLIAVPLFAAMAGGMWLPRFTRHVSPPTDLVTHRVCYDDLRVTVMEHGTIESSANSDIVCHVKARVHGRTVASALKWIIDDGTPVKRGDVVARLDSSGLEEDFKTENLARVQARSAWIQADENYKIVDSQNQDDIQSARIAVQLAELDLQKYLKGDYEQSLQDVQGRKAMAESDYEMSRERVAWSKRMLKKGFLSASQVEGERSHEQSAEIALEKVREELRVLEHYGKRRMQTDLEGKLAEARRSLLRVQMQAKAKLIQAQIDRLVKQSIYQKEEQHCREIEEQLRACTLTAPQDGIVVYHVSDQSRSGSGAQQGIIAQGEPVREGQVLMHIPDLKHMEVETHVHEAVVAHIRGEESQPTGFCDCLQAGLLVGPDLISRVGGQLGFESLHERLRERDRRYLYRGDPALIQVHAFPDRIIHGHVKHISSVFSFWDWRLIDVKLYSTFVSIDEPLEGLKPGMTADVTILEEKPLEHVLTVPVEAIVGPAHRDQHSKCFVLTSEGPEERDVVVGMSSESAAQIKSGLAEGEEVVLNPEILRAEDTEKQHLSH